MKSKEAERRGVSRFFNFSFSPLFFSCPKMNNISAFFALPLYVLLGVYYVEEPLSSTNCCLLWSEARSSSIDRGALNLMIHKHSLCAWPICVCVLCYMPSLCSLLRVWRRTCVVHTRDDVSRFLGGLSGPKNFLCAGSSSSAKLICQKVDLSIPV